MAIEVIKIFPPIGIARLGNSPPDWPLSRDDKGEWFIGPEIPGNYTPHPPWDGHYRDSKFRIKRQAARFHLFGGANDAEASSDDAKEIALADADIKWTVELANTKADWHEFGGIEDPDRPCRNAGVPGKCGKRGSLRITPGARTLDGPNKTGAFDTGTFLHKPEPIYLGEMRTDADGLLLVLGALETRQAPMGIA